MGFGYQVKNKEQNLISDNVKRLLESAELLLRSKTFYKKHCNVHLHTHAQTLGQHTCTLVKL